MNNEGAQFDFIVRVRGTDKVWYSLTVAKGLLNNRQKARAQDFLRALANNTDRVPVVVHTCGGV